MMAPSSQEFDLVVLGGGPPGLAGAITGALLGHRVALVEREHHLGGAGFNTGTVPSKSLRETALALSGWRARKLLGVDISVRRETAMSDLTAARARVSLGTREHTEAYLAKLHVERFRGVGSFVDRHSARRSRRARPITTCRPRTCWSPPDCHPTARPSSPSTTAASTIPPSFWIFSRCRSAWPSSAEGSSGASTRARLRSWGSTCTSSTAVRRSCRSSTARSHVR